MRAWTLSVALLAACTGPTVGGGEPAVDGGAGSAGDAGTAGSGGASPDGALDAQGDASGGAGPVVLASGRDCPTDLRVHAGVVVWTDQGSLQNSAKDGVVATMPAAGCGDGTQGCITVLAKDQHSPSAVEIDRPTNTVYWATVSDGAIWRLPEGAPAPEVFASGQDYPRWLAIDPTALYWTNAGSLGQANGEIRRSWLDSPSSFAIVSGQQSPHALTVTQDAVYWTAYGVNDTDGRLMAALITGENLTEITGNQSDPRGIAASASHVYWANSYDGTIMRSKLDGTEITPLFTGLSTPSDVAVDPKGIYWVEAGTAIDFADGLVKAARLDGTEITTIADDQLDPRRIEIDAGSIYWINRGTQGLSKCAQHDGSVMRADKPW